MNKLINSMALMFMSVMMFANGLGEDAGDPGEPFNDNQQYGSGDPGGEFTTPIDNYTYALIAMAVLIIAYVVYKQRQAKTA